MAEKPTGADKEPCQPDLPCPLCKVPKLSISHLTEHLKKFHKPLAELAPSSKRDDRLRLSPKQKEELTKAIPENRYRSMEYKYSLIRNIVAPEFSTSTDKSLPPSGEEDVKPYTASQSWNLQKYFDDHTENTLNMFMVLETNEKEAVVQHFESLLFTLRTTAASAKGAIGTGSPYPAPALTTPQPTPYPAPIPNPPIPGLVAFEAPFCPPNSFNRAPVNHQSPEWLDNNLLDPEFFEE